MSRHFNPMTMLTPAQRAEACAIYKAHQPKPYAKLREWLNTQGELRGELLRQFIDPVYFIQQLQFCFAQEERGGEC